MPKAPDFDIRAAHKFFAADCFNKTWGILEKAERTEEDDRNMIAMSHASLWHWTQREDCSAQNLSIGYWQLSRVYALSGIESEARRYGSLCLKVSQTDGIPAFCLGYAYEALARAESLGDNVQAKTAYLRQAHDAANRITVEEDKKQFLQDLGTIK